MTKKLTKNDSISTVVKDFDVLAAAFEAMIYESDLWMDYFYWFKKAHFNGRLGEVFTAWKSWAKSRPPKMWLCQAFIWEGTDTMYTKWNSLDNKWMEWLNANFKK